VNAWRAYEELRPDELAAIVAERPVAYWPLGLLEHHGWHLPVGFDGIKARRICERIADRTGGVILPTMWWGGGGGHGDFLWTFYQDEEAAGRILASTSSATTRPTRSSRRRVRTRVRRRPSAARITCGRW
jgi:creatinine amidohydrolase